MRWLLVVTALVAIACWIVVRPTILARRIVTQVNNGDFRVLDSLGLRDDLWQYKEYSYKDMRIEAVLFPRTWRDVFQFRRRVSIDVWPPPNAKDAPGNASSWVFLRLTGPKLGGETWE